MPGSTFISDIQCLDLLHKFTQDHPDRHFAFVVIFGAETPTSCWAVIARSVKTVNDITKCGQMAFGLVADNEGL
jgi:hypothetical protein